MVACFWLGLMLTIGMTASASDNLQRLLIDYLQSPEGQDEIISQLGIPANREDIYLHHIQALFSKSALVNELAENVTNIAGGASLSELDDLGPVFAEVGFGIADNAVTQGMRRLSPDDLRTIIKYEMDTLENLPPNICMAVVNSTLTASQQTAIGIDYQNQLTRPELREYLALTRKAFRAHYAGAPMERSITPSQREIASDTFTKRLSEHQHREVLTQIVANPDRYSDAENCWAIVEIGWIAIEEPGIVGDWLIISMMKTL
jgi:hypothetical protein